MRPRLGQLGQQFFAYIQLRKLRTLATGDLTGPLSISPKQERELFSRLLRNGMIAQVRRGLYLVPERMPLGGKWSPDEILDLNTFMGDQDGRYQICGPNAFNRYGFDEQIPTRVYAYNNRLSGDRRIGSVALTLIKVADQRLGDIEQVKQRRSKSPFTHRARERCLMRFMTGRVSTLCREPTNGYVKS